MAGCTKLSEKDRAEAGAVTAHGDGHQFEIQLGHLCNNRCVFCSSGQLTEMKVARHIPLDPMIAAIEEAKAGGARRITFLGGEPTLHKGFLSALEHSVNLGFEEIVIFTNGVRLPQPGFVDRVVALGHPFEWRISIQGANEAAHVAVTGRPDSYRRIIEGLRILRERGQKVTANLCVNAHNYRSLPEFPELVRAHDIRQLHVDVIRPSSAGERSEAYLREIMPPYAKMAPFIASMLERFESEMPGFDVNVGNLPFCVLPEWAHRIHHGGEETVTRACDETDLEIAVDKYAWHFSMRRHVAACERCVFRPDCSGVYDTYLELHGDSEFQAVSYDALAALTHADHHFVLLAEPWLAPLASAPPPGPWRLENWHRNTREGWIEACYRGPAAGLVSLRFGPAPGDGPGPPGPGVLETDRYRMTVVADLVIPATDVAGLLRWVSDRLEEAVGVVLRRPLDVQGFVRAHRRLRHDPRAGSLPVVRS